MTTPLSAIRTAHEAMLVDSAREDDLAVIGSNNAIPAPNGGDDAMYSRLIQLLAWLPKQINFTVYKLLEIVFGKQEDITPRPWRVYEVNPNEIIIELPVALISASNENAGYMHGWAGFGYVTSGPSDTFTTGGDVTSASATTLVGKFLMFETSPGTWQELEIAAASYDDLTDTSTVQLTSSPLPTGGGYFYIMVEGDDVSSFRGDVISSNGFVGAFDTVAGPDTDTISVVGDCTGPIQEGHAVELTFGGAVTDYEVVSRTYDPSTNRTAVVVDAATVDGGLVNAVIVKRIDVADGAEIPHDKRVYLFGLGKYEIVSQYLDLFVRAAGIVVRLEVI